jgi:calcineurin-like phosphoesterase family protein
MREWIITDTHFDHDNIGVYCARPDGWMDQILRNWRAIVQPEDLVIHLGDVKVGNRHKLTELLYSLPGTKVLIRGNHDNESLTWYMRNGFVAAMDGMAYKQVTFSHRPLNSLYDGTDINIHGHEHNSEWKPNKPFQRLLALEYVGYRPVAFDKFTAMCRTPEKWDKFVATWKPRPRIERKAKNAFK